MAATASGSAHEGAKREMPWFQRCAVMPAASPGRLSDLLRLLGAAPDEALVGSGVALALWQVRGGATLLHEGARAECLHVVRCGTFKCFKTSEDGYEQVLDFAGPGELLGFEALGLGHQPVSVVALEDSSVHALPVRELQAWRQRYPAFDQALLLALSRQMARAGEMFEMMAAVAAEVRLARFLVWLSSRMAGCGQSPRRLRLRMSRRDIASLLGVAHETVSRSFTMLAEWGYLRVDNREVELLDLAGLKACTRSTRGGGEDTVRRFAPPGPSCAVS